MKRTFLMQFAILVVLMLTGLATVANAENRAGAFSVSPMAGAQIFKKSEGFRNAGFVGLNLGYNFTDNWGAELAGTLARVDNRPLGTGDFNYWSGRLDLLYHFRPAERFVPYIAAGAGLTLLPTSTPPDSPIDEDLLVNYGLGFKYFTTDWLALRVDARQTWRHEMSYKPTTHGKNYSNFLISGGLTIQMGGESSEPKMVDSDRDGVIDVVDQCSGTPFGTKVDASGCPIVEPAPVVAEVDTDADGVVDADDLCPQTPEGVEVDESGCEKVVEAVVIEDADADGVADIDDKCPNTPVHVPVNERGCPADTDADGVFDVDDRCPNTEAGKRVDAEGCEVDFSKMDELDLEITFASNSSVIAPEFKVQLQQAADFIKAHPGKKVVVEGHTDNTGSKKANLKLSQKRADTVRWVLVRDFGVNRFSLTAKGYGESQPIADNSTQIGRMANRRVVIRVVE